MTPFAGIFRRDAQPIPNAWIDALVARRALAGRKWMALNAGSAAFVRQDSAADPAPAHNGAIPFYDSRESIVLVDARIDNRAALRDQLGVANASERDDGDQSLVTRAYERWGERCAEPLVGEFAIAAWDVTRRRLFVARDTLGVRPLYYYQSPLVLAFATELPALLALPFVPRGLREDLIADTLRRDGSGPPGRTFYDDISVLPSGHTMIVDGDQLVLKQYWVAAEQPSIVLTSDDAYATELQQRITSAVEQQLHGANTVAVQLSGGLDSAAIACIAARALRRDGRRLLALSSMLPAGYDGPERDERPFVEAVLAQEDNIDVVWVEPDLGDDLFGAHERWFEALAQPPYSTVTHIEQLLGEAGRAHGVDVVLSGFGGDMFASWRGPNVIRDMVRSGRWALALRELRALRREQGGTWSQHLKREVVGPLMPSAVRARRARRREDRACVHPDLARRVDDLRGGPAREVSMATRSPRSGMEFVLEPGHIELPLANVVQVFEQEFSQSLRFPLLDRRVIELMLGVPSEQLQKDGWPRSLMRRAMRGIVPETIRLRPDKGGAFDPAIMSRIVMARERLTGWANATNEGTCWKYVDRSEFLQELAVVERAPREQWRSQTFQTIVVGGLMARFVEWHERTQLGPPV